MRSSSALPVGGTACGDRPCHCRMYRWRHDQDLRGPPDRSHMSGFRRARARRPWGAVRRGDRQSRSVRGLQRRQHAPEEQGRSPVHGLESSRRCGAHRATVPDHRGGEPYVSPPAIRSTITVGHLVGEPAAGPQPQRATVGMRPRIRILFRGHHGQACHMCHARYFGAYRETGHNDRADQCRAVLTVQTAATQLEPPHPRLLEALSVKPQDLAVRWGRRSHAGDGQPPDWAAWGHRGTG
jgi:hypothetical protein